MKVYTLVLSYPQEGGNLLAVSASQGALEAQVKEAIVSCFSKLYDSRATLEEIRMEMSWFIERFTADENGAIVYQAHSSDLDTCVDTGDCCYYIQEWEVANENHDPTTLAEGAEA